MILRALSTGWLILTSVSLHLVYRFRLDLIQFNSIGFEIDSDKNDQTKKVELKNARLIR